MLMTTLTMCKFPKAANSSVAVFYTSDFQKHMLSFERAVKNAKQEHRGEVSKLDDEWPRSVQTHALNIGSPVNRLNQLKTNKTTVKPPRYKHYNTVLVFFLLSKFLNPFFLVKQRGHTRGSYAGC